MSTKVLILGKVFPFASALMQEIPQRLFPERKCSILPQSAKRHECSRSVLHVKVLEGQKTKKGQRRKLILLLLDLHRNGNDVT